MAASLRATWQRVSLEGIPANLAARSSHNLALLAGKAYIFGGELQPRVPVGDELLSIDLPTSSTEDSSHAIQARANVLHRAPSNNAKRWPAARVGAAMKAHAPTQSLFLWGGRGGKEMKPIEVRKTSNDKEESEDLWRFDVDSLNWSQIRTSAEEDSEDLWRFDIDSLKWSQTRTSANKDSDFPNARSFHTLAICDQELYVHAGCPAEGRLSTLHNLDLNSKLWSTSETGPEPGRGGTVLTNIKASQAGEPDLLARWGGFCGYELGGPLEIYDPKTKKWTSHNAYIEGQPGVEPAKRSVHGLVQYVGRNATINVENQEKQIVAIMFMGEGEGAPKELGHDGAGKFLNDVFALLRSSDGTYSWLALETKADQLPEPRGWFAFDVQPANKGEGIEIFIHGGLNESNARLSDAWILHINPNAS